MEVINEVANKAKEQANSQLWNARHQLEEVEAEILKVYRELQDLEDIDSDYNKAYTYFHNSLDSRTTKLSQLEALANGSNSAKTYSVHLAMEMCGNNAIDIIREFDNIKSIISDKILMREETLKKLKSKRDNLEYIIYKANATLYDIENRTNTP